MQSRNFLAVTFLFFLSLLAPSIASIQAPQTQQLDEIHEEIQVNLVNVYLTALDSHDSFVTDLQQEELTIKEDGVPQQISNFALYSEKSESITVVILIDTSLSMNEEFQKQKKIDMAKKGALLLLDQLTERDKMVLIRFSDTPSVATGRISKNQMREVVRAIKTDNGLTALVDAIDLATERLKKDGGQKLIFICSDGEDTASKHTTDEILKKLEDNFDLTVVTLGINAFQAARDSEEGQTLRDGRTLLQSIADNTGGYAFFPKDLRELDQVMGKLKSLIASQYSLGYHPTNSNSDGSWKKIEITCSRPGVKVRYRPGYFSK
jgi:Ca-activated chloride channel family protein